jgi:hypothetical protein
MIWNVNKGGEPGADNEAPMRTLEQGYDDAFDQLVRRRDRVRARTRASVKEERLR